jgi:hypothetical protein
MGPQTVTRWPADMRPEDVPVWGYNAIDTASDPRHVWAWLIRAARWPEWYPHCRHLVFDTTVGPDLAPGVRFSWNTLGVRVHTVVEEWRPYERLAWRGAVPGGVGYHAWVIEPRAGGCRIITEETQRGVVPSMGRWYIRRALRNAHDIWLARLADRARNGPPT